MVWRSPWRHLVVLAVLLLLSATLFADRTRADGQPPSPAPDTASPAASSQLPGTNWLTWAMTQDYTPPPDPSGASWERHLRTSIKVTVVPNSIRPDCAPTQPATCGNYIYDATLTQTYHDELITKDRSWCQSTNGTFQEDRHETIDGTLTSTHAHISLNVHHQADGDTYRFQAAWGAPRPSDKLSIPDKTVYTNLVNPRCGVKWSNTVPFYLWSYNPGIFSAAYDSPQAETLKGSQTGTSTHYGSPAQWTLSWSVPAPMVLQIVDVGSGQPLDPDDATRNPTWVVGQKVRLKVQASNGTSKVMSIHWTDPGGKTTIQKPGFYYGNTVKDYQVDKNVNPTPLGANELTDKQELTFYWVRANTYTLEVSGTINGQKLKATPPVQVVAPTVTNETASCGIGLRPPSLLYPGETAGGWFLSKGVNTNCAGFGMDFKFDVSADKDQGGSFNLTQLFKEQVTETNPTFNINQTTYGFDNGVFYSTTPTAVPGTYTDSDTPNLPLCHYERAPWRSRVTYQESFQTYWMFKAADDTVGKSIWVPLGLLVWGYQATAVGVGPAGGGPWS